MAEGFSKSSQTWYPLTFKLSLALGYPEWFNSRLKPQTAAFCKFTAAENKKAKLLPESYLKTSFLNKVPFNSYNVARRRRAKRPPKADETGRKIFSFRREPIGVFNS